ncbi:MAG: metallophosphoesterase family protein [Planctomycetota bacterium]
MTRKKTLRSYPGRLEGIALAFAAAMVAAVLSAAVLIVTTDAPLLRMGGTWALSFVVIGLYLANIPPKAFSPKYYYFLLVYSLAGLSTIAAMPDARIAAVIGVSMAFGAILLAAGQLFLLALRSFREMPELQPLGDSVFGVPSGPVLCAQFSDIHITASDSVATMEGGTGGKDHLCSVLDRLRSLTAGYLLISGDVTDTGAKGEWERFLETLCPRIDPLETAVLISPGNHDLSPAYGENTRNRLQLFLWVQARTAPSVATAGGVPVRDVEAVAEKEISPFVDSEAPRLREEYIRTLSSVSPPPGVSPALQARLKIDAMNRAIEMANRKDWHNEARKVLLNRWFNKRWYALFPLRLDDHVRKAVFLLLNSNFSGSQLLGDSALGACGKEQLERLAATLSSLSPEVEHVFIVTHHAPFRKPGDWRFLKTLPNSGKKKGRLSRIKERLMAYALLRFEAAEARDLLNSISAAADNHEATFYVLCGHRHTSTAGRYGRVIVLEGSSIAGDSPFAWTIQSGRPPAVGRVFTDPSASGGNA